MRALPLALAGTLALATTGVALAQDMPMKGMSMPASGMKHGQGTGVIKAIDPEAGSVTLQHGPIAAVSWPAMTMTFKAKPALLKGLKVGQTIDFDCDVQGMSAEVTAVRPK
jgi:Cu(I)/Ag(I) efflux system protein CusF